MKTNIIKSAILILGQSELLGLLKEYPDVVYNSELIALNADVYEAALVNNVSHVIYPDWVQSICTYDSNSRINIQTIFKNLEHRAAVKRSEFFNISNCNVDWNFITNYLQVSTYCASILWAKLALPHLQDYDHISIVNLHHPGDFYFDSAIQPFIIFETLTSLNININLLQLSEKVNAATYNYKLFDSLPNINSPEFLNEWHSSSSNILIATAALYSKNDQHKLSSIINKSFKNSKIFVHPLPMWQVINISNTFNSFISIHDIFDSLSDAEKIACKNYVNWITVETEAAILNCLDLLNLDKTSTFRLQINRLHKRHLFQTLTFINWCKVFSSKASQMLAISLQDSGINGPLVNAALLHQSVILLVPHSKIINFPTPCDCVVATEWWQPSIPASLWGHINETIYFDTLNSSPPINYNNSDNKNWLIIYNGLHTNTINSIDLISFNKIVSYIKLFCSRNNINLIHRLKPGNQTPVNTYCELLNLDKPQILSNLSKPLNDLFESSQLVISIDEPSSAIWEALSLGCPVILISDRVLDAESLLDNDIITTISFVNFIKLIESFTQDSNALLDFRNSQQKRYNSKRSSRLLI